MAAPRFHHLTIADIRQETPDAVSLAFAVPPRLAGAYRFAAGQYLTLRAEIDGEDLRRSYSICSGLDDYLRTGELRVAVKRVAGGAFSNFIHDRIKPGDRIAVMTPAGQFTIPLAPEAVRTLVAVACGSGITPVMSLLKTVLAREPHARFVLLYGNRTGRDIIFAEELAGLKDRYLDRLSIFHVLSREMQDVPILQGRLDGARIATLLRAATPLAAIDHAFLCGPAAMMDEAAATFAALGLPAERIHREYFTPGDGGRIAPAPEPLPVEPSAEPAAIAEIIIDGRRHEVPLPAGVSVIDAARAQGIDLPFSCKGGMCCSCRAKLVAGRAEMAVNYSLQPWEIAAGFILTCQARPLTPRLVLDFDAI
ncbi:MAG TPA: 1,2-phenylacetyl-CoA epoxidase subunit PaaE [Stellaceae bacterium]|nr:1,2-phenylacetyl-CoA epoxidase subunit PaaE [Stellaceae bacterium]